MPLRSQLSGILVTLLATLGATCVAANAAAAIVVLQFDLPIDEFAPDSGVKVGDVHHGRVFYDDAKVDPKTHIVPLVHFQHLVGGKWIPESLDPVAMPLNDAWLDVGSRPIRFHYTSAILLGSRILVDASEEGRFTIRAEADKHIIMSAPMVFQPEPVKDVDTARVLQSPKSGPAIVMHEAVVYVDKSAPDSPAKAPYVDKVRVVYDAMAVDPKTHRVKLLNFQHFVRGAWLPPRPDPVMMPTDDSWLDLSTKPYQLHFKAAVVHGTPIIIEAQPKPQELWIRNQSDPKGFIINGPYFIDPRPITGEPADLAGTAPAADKAPAASGATH